MFQLRKVCQDGNAASVHVPRKMQHALGWKRGDTVLVTVVEDCLIMKLCTEAELSRMCKAGMDQALSMVQREE